MIKYPIENMKHIWPCYFRQKFKQNFEQKIEDGAYEPNVFKIIKKMSVFAVK